jgi:ribosomal protein S27E
MTETNIRCLDCGHIMTDSSDPVTTTQCRECGSYDLHYIDD